jgi:hypothetical protein
MLEEVAADRLIHGLLVRGIRGSCASGEKKGGDRKDKSYAAQ